MNEQRQAFTRVHRIGQANECYAWILHCQGGIDDYIQRLQLAGGKFEARLFHSLMVEKLSYLDYMNFHQARTNQAAEKVENSKETVNMPVSIYLSPYTIGNVLKRTVH